jgi:undecaprenyl-diphosphatase
MNRFDRAIDRVAERTTRRVPALDRLFYAASEAADFSVLWHLIGASRALVDNREEAAAVRLSVCLGIEAALVNGPVKSLFNRSRPIDQTPRARQVRQPLTSSFPSGHASAAAMAATLLADRSRVPALWYGLATVVAASRVHVGIHHASDVAAGAGLGLILGRVALEAWPLPPAPARNGTASVMNQ